MRVKVEVTKKHIRKGEKKNCTACPVALALKEKLVKGFEASVFGEECSINDWNNSPFPGNMIWKPLPKKAQRFIERFDNGVKVEPFSFTLNLPAEMVAR